MRKIGMMLLALVMAASLALVAFGDDDDYRGRGPGWMGPGMMGGWGGSGMMGGGMMGGWGGPGMMGGGMMGGGMMGGGMMGFGWGYDADLSSEQRDQLDQLQWDTMRAMRDLMFANRDRMFGMHGTMRKFPLDEAAATKEFQAMNSVHEAMFKLHLSSIAKAQKIVGKEKWEEMMERFDDWGGPGGRGRGPGMMRNR